MNYTELKKAIRGYVENDFPTINLTDSSTVWSSDDQLATFVQQAEQRIYNSVQFPSLRKNVLGGTSANNPYLACPDDFLAPYSLAVIDVLDGRYYYLLNKDVNFIREAYPFPTGAGNTGRPRHYAIFGPYVTGSTITNELSFILGPTPNASYSIELHYYYYPESIVTAGTTWLSDNFDTALLYGALREGYFFIKAEQDMMAAVQSKYDEAMTLAKRLG
ncbi:hypothetical protein EB118_25175, partial [bacterium]|nr:hypothetical protein [bacterium]